MENLLPALEAQTLLNNSSIPRSSLVKLAQALTAQEIFGTILDVLQSETLPNDTFSNLMQQMIDFNTENAQVEQIFNTITSTMISAILAEPTNTIINDTVIRLMK